MRLDIRFGRVGDPPLFPELLGRISGVVEPFAASVLEAGTEQGKTAIGILAHDAAGGVVIFEFTAAILQLLMESARGAEALWRAEPRR